MKTRKPPVRVRPARAADQPALEEFIAPFVEAGKLLSRTPEELQDLVATGFVAVHQRRIVGFATLEVYSPKFAEVRSLCVEPDLQGRGIGKRLVQKCLELAKRRHIFEVMAITSQDGFFKSCGFDFTLPGEKKALFLQTREEY